MTQQKIECILFDFLPDWSTANRISLKTSWENIDIGLVTPQLDVNKDSFNLLTFRFEFQQISYSDRIGILNFFKDMKGRAYSFCLPSHIDDLTLAQDADSTDTTIEVEDDYEVELNVGDFLFIMTGDGTYVTPEIESIGGTTITLTDQIGADLVSGLSISKIYRVHFDSDELSFTLITDTISSTVIDFTEEKRLAADDGITLGEVS